MKFKSLSAVLVGLALLVSGAANAVILDFNDLNVGSNQTSYGSSYNYSGFTFTGTQLSSFDNDTWGMNGDDTDYFGWASHSSDFGISATNGETFSLSSLQIGQLIWNGDGGAASITGTTLGGGTLTQNITVTTSFTDVSFTGWDNLASISISGPPNWMALDNIDVTVGTTTVPEPSTLAIFALGLMGLASRRFKKQS